MTNFYNSNADFKRYVDAYCTKHHIDVDTALTHLIIKNYYEQCKALSERKKQND